MLAMPKLSSLTARAVLALGCDTRDLPQHLAREMDQYRRLQGAFTLQSVSFEVRRFGEGGVTAEEREYAWRCFRKNTVGRMAMENDVVLGRPSRDKWSLNVAEEQRSTTINLQSPLHLAYKNHLVKSCDDENRNSYGASYLENGKFTIVENKAARLGTTQQGVSISTFEIDALDCLTWVQEVNKPRRGLVLVWTTRARRAQSWWDREVVLECKEGREEVYGDIEPLDLSHDKQKDKK